MLLLVAMLVGASDPGVGESVVMPTVVLSAAIAKGEVIDASDLVEVDVSAAKARGALPFDAIIGKAARRPMSAGEAVRSYDVVAPVVVKRNQPVSVIVFRGGLRIEARGKAMSDGAVGAPIRVRIEGSARPVDGVVAANGEIIVG